MEKVDQKLDLIDRKSDLIFFLGHRCCWLPEVLKYETFMGGSGYSGDHATLEHIFYIPISVYIRIAGAHTQSLTAICHIIALA